MQCQTTTKKLKTKKMNRLKTTPKNEYNSNYTDEQLKDTLLSFAILIAGFIALFIVICQITKF